MALTRAFLTGMGLSGEQVSAVIEAHTDTVEALKAQRDEYKAQAESSKTAADELEKLKSEAEKNAGWKEKYEKISDEYETYKNEQASRETRAAKEECYKALLKAAGVSEKRIDTVMKVTDLESIELDKEGKIKGADKLTETIKTEWSDFIVVSNQQGANTQQPPANNGGAPDYDHMSMEEYAAARQKK